MATATEVTNQSKHDSGMWADVNRGRKAFGCKSYSGDSRSNSTGEK